MIAREFVTKQGRIVDVEALFWSHVNKSGPCWVWTGATFSRGYGKFATRGQTVRAHRVSYEWAKGEIPDGLGVLHRCDNTACVRPSHLFAGTNADNVHDMMAKGRNRPPRGERNGAHKLSASDVRKIRALYATGSLSYEALSRVFNVTDTTIGLVVQRRAWRHVS